MDGRLAANLRSFLRMDAALQDRFLSCVFSLLSPDRQQKHADFVNNFHKPSVTVTAASVEAPPSASGTEGASSEASTTCSSTNATLGSINRVVTFYNVPPTSPGDRTAQTLTRRRGKPGLHFPPVVAVDVEYIKTDGGQQLIHSVAIASANDVMNFFVAKLPTHATYKDANLLISSLRPLVLYHYHIAMDVSAIKETVKLLIDGCQVIMWQGDKDKAALDWPSTTFTTDIVDFFRRTDKTPCSLRGVYYTFFREDIYKHGRDARPSARAIYRLFHDVVPHAHKFSYDNIVSNKILNDLAAPEARSKSRRDRNIVDV